MNQWDEAARKAAEEIRECLCDFCNGEPIHMAHLITDAHADLRATMGKLVEMLHLCRELDAYHNSFDFKARGFTESECKEYDDKVKRYRKLESDPLVVKAMKEEK